jgi:DNA-binding IclR family transcriptional regulator
VVQSEFQRSELETLTGLNARSVARALGRLQRIGLVEFKATAITLADLPMPEAGETIRDLAGGRSARRPVPVPRTVLRFLAAHETAALGRVMLGYICRGLSIDRVGGALREAGTVKASWLAETLGLSVRSVRYAQAELREMGWIGKDVGSKQWKLNRHGAWFCINLDWAPVAKSGVAFETGKGALDCVPIARPTPESCTPVAPPKEDRKTPSESKDRRTASGLCKTDAKPNPKISPPKSATLPRPTLRDIRREDLHSEGRLRELFAQAVAKGWVKNCQADALNFFGAAVRARNAGNGDPVRIFVSLVRRRLWNHITQAQEDEARRTVQRHRQTERSKVEPAGAEPGRAGQILESILQRLPMPKDGGRTPIPSMDQSSCSKG